jgi:hypothetical protein
MSGDGLGYDANELIINNGPFAGGEKALEFTQT